MTIIRTSHGMIPSTNRCENIWIREQLSQKGNLKINPKGKKIQGISRGEDSIWITMSKLSRNYLLHAPTTWRNYLIKQKTRRKPRNTRWIPNTWNIPTFKGSKWKKKIGKDQEQAPTTSTKQISKSKKNFNKWRREKSQLEIRDFSMKIPNVSQLNRPAWEAIILISRSLINSERIRPIINSGWKNTINKKNTIWKKTSRFQVHLIIVLVLLNTAPLTELNHQKSKERKNKIKMDLVQTQSSLTREHPKKRS